MKKPSAVLFALCMMTSVSTAQINIDALNGGSTVHSGTSVNVSREERQQAMRERADAPGSIVGNVATNTMREALSGVGEYGMPPAISFESKVVDSITPITRTEYFDTYNLTCRSTETEGLILSQWESFFTTITITRETGIARIEHIDFDETGTNVPRLAESYCLYMIAKYGK